MPLAPGARLGSYEILAAIGAGGMGEVYRGRDHKLNRDVALKILPAMLSGDPDRLARFQREAQVLAALNHPNIAAIYGFEDSGPIHALVLELVEGPTLADRLADGPVPVAEAIVIARQMADALAVAHEVGIVHRDLKPANIKVREDGTVKVLDFGLAKALAPDGAVASASAMNSPTLTARGTEVGMIVGTAAYMAPEQARGKAVDRRADLWAFGVVLYEMLTGRRAFDGPEVSDVLASVLKDTPSFDGLPDDTPPAVRRLLRRTLEKDRARRLDSMAAARLELDEVAPDIAALSAHVAPPREPARARLVPVIIAAVVSALVVGFAVWRAMQPEPPEVRRFAITPAADAPIAVETNHHDVAITPDGTRVVYFSRVGIDNQLVVRSLDRYEPTVLKGIGTDPRGMFTSPDGAWIGFFTGGPGTESALAKVPMAGGAPVPIARVTGNLRGASWGADGTIVFATHVRETGLLGVPAAGGEPEVLTTPATADGELDHLWPDLLPDGRHVLFSIARAENRFDVALLSLQTGTWRVLVPGGVAPRYVETGHILYGSAGALRAVRFDAGRLETEGEPIEVLSGVRMKDSGAADFAVSRTGTLVYLPGTAQSARRALAWRAPDGAETVLAIPPAEFSDVRISPDPRWAVAEVGLTAGSELWLLDLSREVSSRLTPAGLRAMDPVWSRDGRSIAFWSPPRPEAKEPGGIFLILASGTATPVRLTSAEAEERHAPGSWTADQSALLFTAGSGNDVDIRQVTLDGSRTVTPVLAGPDIEAQPTLSPDGRWLAYVGVEARRQIFIRPFPDVGRVRIPVTTDGGQLPAWAPDGRALYYRDLDLSEALSVRVDADGDVLTISRPQSLANRRDEAYSFAIASAALPPVNGRILSPFQQEAETRGAEYRVVLNWFEELKNRVAAR